MEVVYFNEKPFGRALPLLLPSAHFQRANYSPGGLSLLFTGEKVIADVVEVTEL